MFYEYYVVCKLGSDFRVIVIMCGNLWVFSDLVNFVIRSNC